MICQNNIPENIIIIIIICSNLQHFSMTVLPQGCGYKTIRVPEKAAWGNPHNLIYGIFNTDEDIYPLKSMETKLTKLASW